MAKLGRLQRVTLRDVWESEAGGFTPWLAKPENLELLGETLGIELELEAQEKNVGPFRADILCKDTITNQWVLVENQLERTDHTHLGQLITYAAGLDAVTIVWISDKFTLEHRAALDWLNEITNERAYFFGLEVELWQIGGSPVAPKFNIISQPNDWSKAVTEVAKTLGNQQLSETKQMQYDFWSGFKDYLEQRGSFAKPTTPSPRNWMGFAAGRSNFYLYISMNTIEKTFTVGLAMQGADAKAHFKLLQAEKEEIEKEIGQKLEWINRLENIESYITIVRSGSNPFEPEYWPEYYEWFASNIEAFLSTLRPRIKDLDASQASDLG